MKKQKKFEKYLNSVVTSHGDMEEDRREIEKNVKKILELFENNHEDVADRSDLVFLVNDIKKRFHSLYGRHDGLIGKIKSKVHQRKGDSSSGTSDSGMEDSSDDDGANSIHEPNRAQQISLEDYPSVWDQFDCLSKRNAELEAQTTSMQAKFEESQRLTDDLAEREILITKLENELQTVRDTLKLIEAKNEFLKKEIENSKEQEVKFGLLLRDLQEANEVLRLEKENISNQLLEAHNSVTRLEIEHKNRTEEMGKVRDENSYLRVELDKTAQEVAHLNQQIVVVGEEQESLRTVGAELKLANDSLMSENAEMLSENLNLKAQQEASTQQVANLNDRLLMIEGENDALKSEVQSLSTHMHEADKIIKDMTIGSGLLKEDISKLNDINNDLNNQLKVKDDEKTVIELKSSEASKMAKQAEERVVMLSAEIERMKTEYSLLLTGHGNLKQELEFSNQELSKLKQALETAESERKSLVEENSVFLTKHEKLKLDMEGNNQELSKIKQAMEATKSERNSLIEENSVLLTKYENLKLDMEGSNQELSKIKQAMEATESERNSLIEENSSLLTKYENIKLDMEGNYQKMSKIKQAMEAKESERNSLIEEKSVLLTRYENLMLDMEGNNQELSRIKQVMEAIESGRNSLIEERSVLLTKYENLKLDKEGDNQELSKIKQAMEAIESERNSLIEERSVLLTKYENLKLDMEGNNQELSKIKQAMESIESERYSLIEERSVLLTKYENLNLDMEGNNQELSKIKQAMEATESERNSLIEEKSALLSKIDEVMVVIDGLKAHIEEVGVEKSQLQLNISNLDLELQATNAQLTDVKNGLVASEEEKKALISQNSVVESNLLEAELRSEGLLTELGKLKEKNSVLQSKIEGAEKTANDFFFERDGLIMFNAHLEIKAKELITELETANARLNHLEELKIATEYEKANFKSEILILSGKLHQTESDNEKLVREIELLREKSTALQQNQTELGNRMVEHEKRFEHALSGMQDLKDILEQAHNEVSHKVHSLVDTFKADILELAAVKGCLDHELKKLAEITSENEVSLKKMKTGLSSKISDQEALLKKDEELLIKHKQLEDSYFESCTRLEAAEKRLEEMEMKEQTILRLDGLCLDLKKEIGKLNESYRELLEKLSSTELAKIDAYKDIQRLEVALRLSNQKLKITETEYKEKEERWKALNKGLQNELKLLDRQVLMWSEKFTMLNNECRQLEGLLQAGMGTLEDDLNEIESTSLENIEHVKKQVTECLAELQKMQALLELELHKKQKLENENHELELILRDKEGIISKLKDEAGLKVAKLADKEKELVILEKNLKEKEREVLDRGEEKREAIRQLCLLIEYHWENCNHLVKYLSSVHRSRRTS